MPAQCAARRSGFRSDGITEGCLSGRHLVLSDLHENHEALSRFISRAKTSFGGFDDIWCLGDIFGHSMESVGQTDMDQGFLNSITQLQDYPLTAVWGNWEYWLSHPEMDDANKNRQRYEEQLKQRRRLLNQKKNRRLSETFLSGLSAVRAIPEDDFTLFHGCSYSCYGNSAYQPEPWECYLYPRDLNVVTRGLFGSGEHLKTSHFLFGHTHIPGWFVYSRRSMVNMWRVFSADQAGTPIYYGNENQRFGINPGSAGVSGGRMPRTAVLLDTQEKTFTYIIDED